MLSLAIALTAGALGCQAQPSAAARGDDPAPVLQQSWKAYLGRFVQADGRVIDHKAGDISTSEGQSYAMLRAVWIDDRATFDKAYSWGRDNLNSNVRSDHLWAWKWGKGQDGKWRVLDKAFATDADQDVALALILAYRRWNRDEYLADARAILGDLWNSATREIAGKCYLLAGDSLCKAATCRLNPSYYAPYAYRIFARFDTAHDWMRLVDNSYFVLDAASSLTQTRLPPDWIEIDTRGGRLTLPAGKDGAFSYDALRVYWRIAMDWELFQDERAQAYLRRTLPALMDRWRQGTIPAVIAPDGKPLAQYESLEMIAAIMPGAALLDPAAGRALAQHLQSKYAAGFWDDKDSYYLQNWAWFGTALYDGFLAPFRSLRP